MSIPLTELKTGQKAKIVRLVGGRGIHRRLELLGIRPGSVIMKISNPIRSGAVVLQVGESQVAIGYGIINRIVVEVLT